MMTGTSILVRAWIGLALSGCETGAFDLERMIDQPRYESYEGAPEFDDGRAMRSPVTGTVARNALLGPTELVAGRTEAGEFIQRIPVPLTLELMQRGRDRFDTFCAPCHGTLGDGDSQVAENMELRRPPSFLDPTVARFPDGRIYAAMAQGYGLMPAYAAQLPVSDRWAVVAYIRALIFSQGVPLQDLAPSLQKEAEPWLR